MGCCEKEEKDMAHEMLHLADCAWYSLMKEKMKKVYEKERGQKMDQVADISAKAAIDFWTKKMAGEEPGDEFYNELRTRLDAVFKS